MIVALVIQHAKRMLRIILSSVACPAVPNYSTHKLHVSRKKLFKIEFVFWFLYNFCLEQFSFLEEISELS